jgi:hypothetical protein
VWDIVLEGSDMTKAVIGAIVNPLWWEMILCLCRMVLRTAPHAHESTIGLGVAVASNYRRSRLNL